jgi:hypothetical protein
MDAVYALSTYVTQASITGAQAPDSMQHER